jgi:hypothetical protein
LAEKGEAGEEEQEGNAHRLRPSSMFTPWSPG